MNRHIRQQLNHVFCMLQYLVVYHPLPGTRMHVAQWCLPSGTIPGVWAASVVPQLAAMYALPALVGSFEGRRPQSVDGRIVFGMCFADAG